MPSYLFFSIISLVFFSASIIIFRLTAKYAMPNPYAWFFWYFLIYFILGLFLPLFNSIQIIPSSIKDLFFNIPYAIAIFIGIFCFAHAIYKLDVTTMGPLSNIGNVFTPLLAFLFLGELVPLKNLPWLFLIIVSGIFSAAWKHCCFFNWSVQKRLA